MLKVELILGILSILRGGGRDDPERGGSDPVIGGRTAK